MTESAPHNEPDVHKRRSKRIVQAVPLTVTGVDALGRPFQERTSTLIINCHGCRYQSKHYVLKNMWVTLEVPHPETGRAPRDVRGRVTWIQRPRTVRELFQIGVELEVPGNIWGIAFPPADWFPAPDSGDESLPQSGAETPAEESAAPWAAHGAPQADNVVVMGGVAGGTDMSLQLARQVARLVVEAKQQIQAAVREATSKSITQEVKLLLSSVESQLQAAANKASQEAASNYSNHWLEQAGERMELQARASVESLREQLSLEMDARMDEARTLIAARMASVEQTEQENFKSALNMSVEGAIDRLRLSAEAAAARSEQASEQIERSRQQLSAAVEEASRRWETGLSSETSGANSQMEKLHTVAGQISAQIQDAIQQGEQVWRARMATDVTEAQKHAAATTADAVERTIQDAREQLSKQSREGVERLQEQADNQMAALRRHAEYLYAQATQSLGEFRTEWQKEAERSHVAFLEIERSAGRVSEIARQIEQVEEATITQVERRSKELLETTTRELNTHSEAAVARVAERFQPILDEAGAQSVAKLGEHLKRELAPQIDSAREIIEKISSSQAAADEVLRAHQDRLWQASEQHLQQIGQRQQEESSRMEKDSQESVHLAMAKSIEDLDARTTDITHSTVESLYKSSQWYEKKVQTQMQSCLDKGIEQAGEALRVRAGEMSALFGSELDHYSRSFVEHTREQLTESAKNEAARAQQTIREAVDAGSAEVGAKARRAAQVELERFTAGMRNSFDQSAAYLDAHTIQVRARMSTESRQFIADFQLALTQRAQESLRGAGKELDAQTDAFREAAQAERTSQEKEFGAYLIQAGDAALETYKGRMENASNAWLLSSAARLSQQAEKQMETLACNAELKLRETFSQVFASVGDTLRQRLLDASGAIPMPPPSHSPSPTPSDGGPEQK